MSDEIIQILEDYSNFLHNNNYMDSDYYTEEPKAIDRFIEEYNKKLKWKKN